MSVFVEWTRTVQDHFVRLQKLLGRGRELLINWEAPMASTFISSFSAQGGRAEGGVAEVKKAKKSDKTAK